MDALDGGEAGQTLTVERINPPPHPARHRVLVRLDAQWPQGFEPFNAERFQPYRADSEDRAHSARSDPPSSDQFLVQNVDAAGC